MTMRKLISLASIALSFFTTASANEVRETEAEAGRPGRLRTAYLRTDRGYRQIEEPSIARPPRS